MDEKTILYLVASLLVAVLIFLNDLKFGIIGAIAAILAVIAIAVILLLAFADFLIYPLFTKVLKITTIPAKNYTIPKSNDAIIKYINGVYYATGYLTGNIYGYVFAQEQKEEAESALIAAPEKWEKAVMNVHFPFKLNIVTSAEDIQRYRDELETKRGLLEFQYSKETESSNPSPMGLENIQRQINVIQARIDRMSQNERPISAIMYLETTAVGVSEKEAEDNLSNQLNELQTIFNVFDLSITRVIGRELYHLFKINYIVPSTKELYSTFQAQS